MSEEKLAETPELSVVIPAYNEAGAIEAALEDVRRDVLSVVPDAEVIVVDDGSTDETRALAEAMAARDARIRVLHQQNGGHGAALLAGLGAAAGQWLLLLDSDRQIGLDRFGDHWREVQGHDALIGQRARRQDPLHRLVITRAMRGVIRALFGAAPRDAGVPYKLLRQSAWAAARAHVPQGSAIPSVLLAIWLMERRAARTLERPVPHMERRSGRTVLRWGRLARLCRAGLSDILTLRRSLRRDVQTSGLVAK